MSAAEIDARQAAIAALRLPVDTVATRRFRADARGARIDPRATMRAALRTGGELILPKFRSPREVHPPLVVLADISGSMSQYTRIFLHFLHALTEKRRRVHTFVFGTRLTNVTRADAPPRSRRGAGRLLGGGAGLVGRHAHRRHAARVQPALVAPGAGAGRGRAADHRRAGARRRRPACRRRWTGCSKSCRRLIWLNPLLRFDGFEARARGVRAMLPHVDEFRAVHNLDALADLCASLSTGRARAMSIRGAGWQGRSHGLSPARRTASWRTSAHLDEARDPLLIAEGWMTRRPQDVAIATVVETWGSAPRPVGSHLVIDADGNFQGSVSGGCVEGAVVTEAIDVIDNGKPRMLEFGVADETAWRVGLSCGGRIRVYVEQARLMRMDIASPARHSMPSARARRAAILRHRSRRRQRAGSMREGDAVAGELGEAVAKAFRSGKSGIGRGRRARAVSSTSHLPPPRLVVIGAVHISQALAPMARHRRLSTSRSSIRAPPSPRRSAFPDVDAACRLAGGRAEGAAARRLYALAARDP